MSEMKYSAEDNAPMGNIAWTQNCGVAFCNDITVPRNGDRPK